MGVTERKLEIERKHPALISQINGVIGTASRKDFEKLLAELSDLEKEYSGIMEKEVFSDHPSVEDILAMYQFNVLGHKSNNKDGKLENIEPILKPVVVNLKSYCEYHKYKLDWFYEMQAFNKRLALRLADDIGVSAKRKAEIQNDYYLHKFAKQIELGQTPTSNTQVVRHLQQIFDMLCPGTGKKVNNRDLAFIERACSKLGKDPLTLVTSKHNALMGILLRVFHRVVTGAVYDESVKLARKTEQPAPVKVATEAVKKDKPTKKPSVKKSKKSEKPAPAAEVAPATDKPAEEKAVEAPAA